MPNDWKLVKLGEVLGQKGYIRGPFGSALKRGELQSSGIPVYEQQHAIYGTREFRFFIDENKHRELSRFTVQPNDLIISCSGTLGRVSIIRDTDPIGIISQALLILRPDTRVIDPRFLYQILSSPAGFYSLVSVSTGSVQVNIAKRSIIENVDLLLPPLSEQSAIAHILGILDEKIEINQQINETVETMARALFKSWFVDFDPVRAKMDGRWKRGQSLPGLPVHFYDLFPKHLVKCDVGEVPEGWSYSKLKEITSYLNRGLPPKYLEEGGTMVLNQKCIRNGIVDFTKSRRHDDSLKGTNGRELQIGDILVNSTGVGTLGRVAQILYLPEKAIVDTHVTIVRSSPAITSNFLGLNVLSRQTEIEALGEGSTGQIELSRVKLGELQVILPTIEIIREFDLVTIPLRSQVSSKLLENNSLKSLRDLLLPKLISGELRVKDAEKIIGDAS